MTSLMQYAEKLATDPPLDVYRKLMKLFSDAAIAALGPQPKDVKKLEKYNKEKESLTAIANKWNQMEQDWGKLAALFSVTSICDFIAMCVMMIGAGSQRIEDLKKSIRGKDKAGIFKTAANDRAYLLTGNQAPKQFDQIMETWCKLEGNGLVQFKFPAGYDLHTFVVERATDDENQKTHFVVYQAYQNTYSLSHFLGLTSPQGDKGLDDFHRERWKTGFKDQYETYKGYYDAIVTPQLKNIATVTRAIGRKQKLTDVTLAAYVLEPLLEMLSGATAWDSFIGMTGAPPHETKSIGMKFMILFVCDQISPNKFQENFNALGLVPANLTMYPECEISPY